MATIKLFVSLNNISSLLERYDSIEIHRCATYDGTYAEITTSATRPRMEPGKSLYIYYDESGSPASWYKTRLISRTGSSTEFSEPSRGDETDTLASIMTVDELKAIYLTGVDLTDDKGNPFPDIMFDFAIRAAIHRAEIVLDLECRPTWHDDRYDFDAQLWQAWGIIHLNHNPVIQVDYVKMYWPSANDPYEFPDEWIRLNRDGGYLTLVPTSGTLTQAMSISGVYMPIMLSRVPFIPEALNVRYQSGFAIGTLPYQIREMIGKMACFPILNTAGDLIAGAGIANFSISMDGLSQSIGTTSSATNSGYGARLTQFTKELKDQIPDLRRYYKGAGLRVG